MEPRPRETSRPPGRDPRHSQPQVTGRQDFGDLGEPFPCGHRPRVASGRVRATSVDWRQCLEDLLSICWRACRRSADVAVADDPLRSVLAGTQARRPSVVRRSVMRPRSARRRRPTGSPTARWRRRLRTAHPRADADFRMGHVLLLPQQLRRHACGAVRPDPQDQRPAAHVFEFCCTSSTRSAAGRWNDASRRCVLPV